ncbi:MAG: DNA-3-methyladenine glycosylase 2 [Oscillospiraceae bacterium]|jgi:N-glycosylase/DNA lyase|nr:DNA-3-methyladenine glycosylase 2 [Oscillospiraceae bacterium]
MEFLIKTDFFNPELTLTGGQAFRWRRIESRCYFGIAGRRTLTIRRETNGVRLLGISDKELPFWLEYLDISTDYESIIRRLSEDTTLRKACRFAHGLRLLRQEPFETLISFIISQNNNIPRITGIIERLCMTFGAVIEKDRFAFPEAEVLAELDEADLSAIGAGYRARYITDAARKTLSGEINLNALYKMQTEEARRELMKIKGVGGKVADCILLFAYRKSGAFPKDVHIKRVLENYYPAGLPECTAGYEGIAQQYLFEYIRNHAKNKNTEENLCSVQNADAG